MKLRFAPATIRFLENNSHSGAHAVLLTGPIGIGLATLARHVATSEGRLLAFVAPESKSSALPSISAERIRQLYIETKSKLEGVNFVIIDNADTMNHVAQNALLKLLEEPNESFRFILTSHSPDKLLATIRSRTQHFAVPPISALDSKRHLTALGVTEAIDEQRLLYVAAGLPAELARLAANTSDFKALSERVQMARQLIQGSSYERLATTMSFSGDRQEAIRYIDTVVLLLRRSLVSNPDRATVGFIERLLHASDAIRSNGNIKLHLSVAVL